MYTDKFLYIDNFYSAYRIPAITYYKSDLPMTIIHFWMNLTLVICFIWIVLNMVNALKIFLISFHFIALNCAVVEYMHNFQMLKRNEAMRFLAQQWNASIPSSYFQFLHIKFLTFMHTISFIACIFFGLHICHKCQLFDFLRMRNSRFIPEYLYGKNWVFVCQFDW